MAVSRWLLPVTIGLWVAALLVQWVSAQGQSPKEGERLLALITTYAQNYRGLSDELAGKLLTEYLAIEKARLQVRTKYVPRFQKVLPPKQVARYYQVENKLDVIIQAELAEE